MVKRKGKPLSDAEKAARDRTEKALKKVKREQAGEEAGTQIEDRSGDLFPPEKPPSREK
jgi:hypothetical protein